MPPKNKKLLIVFGSELPGKGELTSPYDTIVATASLREEASVYCREFVDLDSLTASGSVVEASAFLKELSQLEFANGVPVRKSLVYKGYDLWWIHYDGLYHYFSLPFIRYKKLLAHMKEYEKVDLYNCSHVNLFLAYGEAYNIKIHNLNRSRSVLFSLLSPGMLLQCIVTFLSFLFLLLKRPPVLVFAGDKLEAGKDYDFRMEFIYRELRERKLPFVEFIRSLEPWRTLAEHMKIRMRPVIYSSAIVAFAAVLSRLFGTKRRKFASTIRRLVALEQDPEQRFKFLIATHHIVHVYDDIWGMLIMKRLISAIGIRVGLFTAALDRNLHAVLGCKLNGIPTVGIQHALAPRQYVQYDYLPGFDGEKMLSVDIYGLWSEWWRDYYAQYSRAYRPAQLLVSGPMRPVEDSILPNDEHLPDRKIKALFIAEQNSVPREVMPYIKMLLEAQDIQLAIKFRPSSDQFEEWLIKHEPNLLTDKRVTVIKGNIRDAIRNADVVVGCQSTSVLEALFQGKVPLFMNTPKWGDYYGFSESEKTHPLFADTPDELVAKIMNIRTISREFLAELRTQYLGDPHKNGSVWIVDRVEALLKKSK